MTVARMRHRCLRHINDVLPSECPGCAEQRGREQAETRIAELEGLLRHALDWDTKPEWVAKARAALAKGGGGR